MHRSLAARSRLRVPALCSPAFLPLHDSLPLLNYPVHSFFALTLRAELTLGLSMGVIERFVSLYVCSSFFTYSFLRCQHINSANHRAFAHDNSLDPGGSSAFVCNYIDFGTGDF